MSGRYKGKGKTPTPSSSKRVLADAEKQDTPASNPEGQESSEPCTKRSRLKSSIWKKAEKTDQKPSSCSGVGNVMTIGKLVKIEKQSKELVVRVSFTKSGEKFFKFYGVDESGEIEFIGFNETGRKIGGIVRINGVYKIKNYKVDTVSMDYPSATGNALVVKLFSDAQVQEVEDDDSIPQIPFKFCAISEIVDKKIEKNSKIDVVAVIGDIFEAERTSSGKLKREMLLTQKDKSEVCLRVWEELCKVPIRIGDAVALRMCQVKEEDEDGEEIRFLNSSFSTLFWVNPVLPNNEAGELCAWFEEERKKP